MFLKWIRSTRNNKSEDTTLTTRQQNKFCYDNFIITHFKRFDCIYSTSASASDRRFVLEQRDEHERAPHFQKLTSASASERRFRERNERERERAPIFRNQTSTSMNERQFSKRQRARARASVSRTHRANTLASDERKTLYYDRVVYFNNTHTHS